MKNQIVKPVAIIFILALVSLSISASPPNKPDKDFAYKIGGTGPGVDIFSSLTTSINIRDSLTSKLPLQMPPLVVPGATT
jgi:hypothetical protein